MDEAGSETLVVCRTGQGGELRGVVRRMSRHGVTFELPGSSAVLQLSEVLTDFQVTINTKLAYQGRAVIRNVVNTGVTVLCEVSLEDAWQELDSAALSDPSKMREEFSRFVRGWQKAGRIQPAFKLVVADLHEFLSDLWIWLEQVELALRSSPSDSEEAERGVVEALGESAIPVLDELFDRYEVVMGGVDAPLKDSHRAYAKRQLHPLLLSSPFAERTFSKPLGYAGDYGMVNMIVGEPFKGGGLFAKVIDRWFLRQAPAVAHRNRIDHLQQVLMEEAVRVTALGREARVLSLGCGPAVEVQRFLARSHASNRCRFTLYDFNEETLEHARLVLERAKLEHGRTTVIELVRKSVNQLLRDAGGSQGGEGARRYDFVYCAGLFDYLSDPVCKRLVAILYEAVVPGGLLLVTNVDACNPRQHTMESFLDWNLVYRNHRSTEALIPASVTDGAALLRSDDSGVNLFVEIRRLEDV